LSRRKRISWLRRNWKNNRNRNKLDGRSTRRPRSWKKRERKRTGRFWRSRKRRRKQDQRQKLKMN
jgi:hypothetical protein